LVLSPTLAIITNIDAEHLDHYGSLERLIDAFVGFANRVPFYGMTVVCLDDANVRAIRPRLTKRTVSYAITETSADYRAVDITTANGHSSFRVLAHGVDRGRFEITMPGRHNIQCARDRGAVRRARRVDSRLSQGVGGVLRGPTPVHAARHRA
jgi:UDP-N-acetylmuramate--alanine ligase